MAVESDVIGLIAYDGDGIVTNLVVPFLFSIPTDLVIVDTVVATGVETTKTYITDYTVTGGGGNPGVPTTGTVVMNVAPAAGHRTTIKRDLPILQPLTLVPNTALPSASLMYVLDRIALMIQDQFENFTRALSSTVGSNLSDLQISSLTTSAILQVNASDNTIIGSITLADLAVALGASVSGFGTIAVSGQSNIVAAQANDTLTIVAGSGISLATSSGAKSITITSSGGGGGGTTLISVTQSSHGFSVGQVLYLSGSTYTKAIATSAAASEVVGVVSAVADVNTFSLTTNGRITGLTGLTAGQVSFLDGSTAGAVSTTQQTTVGNIDKPVWVADSTTSAILIPYRGTTVGAALTAAAQADMVAGTSSTLFVVPSVVKHNPGVVKASVQWTVGGTTINYSNNVTSITRTAAGDYTVNFTSNFANTTDMRVYCGYISSATMLAWAVNTLAVGSVRIQIRNTGGTLTDPSGNLWVDVLGTF